MRVPNLPKPYVLTETPFVSVLSTLLQEALLRPTSVYHKQRNHMAWLMEAVLVPSLLVR